MDFGSIAFITGLQLCLLAVMTSINHPEAVGTFSLTVLDHSPMGSGVQ